VKVKWQEIQQYETVVEVELEPGMLRTKAGRHRVGDLIREQLSDLSEEQLAESVDENWHGPHLHVDDMQPIWDAVETPPGV
jgi:hypothetical protein